MTRILISNDAHADLDAIYEFVYRDRPRAAERLIDRLATRMKRIRTSPESGELCEFLGPGIRRVVVGRYAIFCHVAIGQVSVLRVLHNAREMPSAFFDPPG